MEGLALGVVLAVVVAVALAAAWAAKRTAHPEQAAGHGDPPAPADAETVDRPAGPGAEDPIGPTRDDRQP